MAVSRLRQVKSEREIETLRAVNTGTLEALRAMRKCMSSGLTEVEVKTVLDKTLKAGGLEPVFDVVSFGKSIKLSLECGNSIDSASEMKILQTHVDVRKERKPSMKRLWWSSALG